MAEINVHHYDGVPRTPALLLALKGNVEIVEAGFAVPAVHFNWDSKAVVASIDGVPCGVITWNHTEWMKQVDITVAYVLPEYRRRGVYRAMWEALVEKAKVVGALEIMSNTAVANAPMRGAAAAVGRSEGGVILRFPLCSQADGSL